MATNHIAPRDVSRKRAGAPRQRADAPLISVDAIAGVPEFVRGAFGERVLRQAQQAAMLDLELIADSACFVPQWSMVCFPQTAAQAGGQQRGRGREDMRRDVASGQGRRIHASPLLVRGCQLGACSQRGRWGRRSGTGGKRRSRAGSQVAAARPTMLRGGLLARPYSARVIGQAAHSVGGSIQRAAGLLTVGRAACRRAPRVRPASVARGRP